jgi:hypothetical protein
LLSRQPLRLSLFLCALALSSAALVVAADRHLPHFAATDKYEAAASTLQPQGAKSTPQKAADEATESNTHGPQATKSTVEKIKVRCPFLPFSTSN